MIYLIDACKDQGPLSFYFENAVIEAEPELHHEFGPSSAFSSQSPILLL